MRTRFGWMVGMLAAALLAGCPGADDDDSAGDDDTTGDDDACAPLDAGPVIDWDGASALEVGDVAELTADDGSFAFELAEDGDYLAMVISRSLERDTVHDVSVDGGAAARSGGASEPGPPPAGDGFAPPRVDDPQPLRETIGDSSLPEIGDVRTFEVVGVLGPFEIHAEAIAVTDEVVVYKDIDTEHDLPDIDDEYLDEALPLFEEIVLPRERFFFHQEPDVNGDGHISLLFSYTVNAQGVVAYVSECDLQPHDVCGYGNEQEIIYANIPDPSGPYDKPTSLVELMAHEFNHTIYFASRYLSTGDDDEENIYVTEGMSALAQDLTGYNNGNQYVWGLCLDDIAAGSAADVLVYDPASHYDAERDGTLRGVAYLLLRYLYDRQGPEGMHDDGTFDVTCGIDLLHGWFQTSAPGLDAVEALTGLDADTYLTDFWTAMGVHQRVDEGMAADPAYHFAEQVEDPLTGNGRGVNFLDTIHGWLELDGVATEDLDAAGSEQLRAGGALYLLASDVDAPRAVTVEVGADADAVLRVVRLD